ncbi:hypothetical protein [Synechococcus phage BUCT-ZZ01]|nr:hypothetical protein [Synechococcus phage BUCT-ZZ01]
MANDFKTFVQKAKSQFGIHRRSMYYVEIRPPQSMPARLTSTSDVEVLGFYCHNLNIPGMSFSTDDNYKDGKYRRKVVYDYNYNDISASFYIDANFNVVDYFKDWSASIMRENFVANYPEQYSTTMRIFALDEEHKNVRIYEYENVYPKTVNDIALNAAGGNDISTIDINFVYTNYKVIDPAPLNPADTNDVTGSGTNNFERFQQNPLFKEFAASINLQSITKGAISSGIGAIGTGKDPRAVSKIFFKSTLGNIQANVLSFATTKGASVLFGALDGLFTKTESTGQLSSLPFFGN